MLAVPCPRIGILRCRGRDLEYGRRTLVMGIVNVTPDSFSGDGFDHRVDEVVARARQMVTDGADVIDVGGESTNPRARPVAVSEESARVVPAVQALVAAVSVPISVDTRKPAVAEAALRAGAHMINDVAGLQRDPGMAAVVASFGAPVVIMHSPGEPWDVKWPASYGDVVSDVRDISPVRSNSPFRLASPRSKLSSTRDSDLESRTGITSRSCDASESFVSWVDPF